MTGNTIPGIGDDSILFYTKNTIGTVVYTSSAEHTLVLVNIYLEFGWS